MLHGMPKIDNTYKVHQLLNGQVKNGVCVCVCAQNRKITQEEYNLYVHTWT